MHKHKHETENLIDYQRDLLTVFLFLKSYGISG